MIQSKTLYHNAQQMCTLGKTINNEKFVENTVGLEPVYCIPGVINSCNTIDERINLKVKQEKECNMNSDEETLKSIQEKISRTNKLLSNFMEEFVIEKTGADDEKLECPEKISNYANKNCKNNNCYGRGIVGWVYLDKNKKPIQFNEENPYYISPQLCKCVYPKLIEILYNQDSEEKQ